MANEPCTSHSQIASGSASHATVASPRCLTLDVVIPTFNRCDLLRKAVTSVLNATRPPCLKVTLIVVDNNSTDRTAQVVQEMAVGASIPLRYVTATSQGSSAARNKGIAAGTAELIGFIDDDEEVHSAWLQTIAREFADATVQYIGGPCLLERDAVLPAWLPPGYHAAIGAIPPKPRATFGPRHQGILCGGNAVVRRRVFDVVGQYSPRLGRSARRLLSEEDAEFYRRLQAAGIHGIYVPELIILHHVHAARLTRKYHRRWAYWRAVSQGVLARESQESVAYLFGVPRYRVGRATRGVRTLLTRKFSRTGQGVAFAGELALWDLAGFVYGKFFFEEGKHYTTVATAGKPAFESHDL